MEGGIGQDDSFHRILDRRLGLETLIMKSSFRILACATATAAVVLLSGCAVAPADPYYNGYGYGYGYGYDYAYPGAAYVGPGPYYAASPYLVAPAVSVGLSGVWYGGSRGYHGGWRGPGWRGGPGWHGGGGGWRGPGGGFRGGGWGGHGGGHR